MTTSISSLFLAVLSREQNLSSISVKTKLLVVVGIPKCGLTFLHLKNWRRCLEICLDSNLINNTKIVQMFNICKFWRYKEGRPQLGKLIRRTLFHLIHIIYFVDYQKSKTIFTSSLNFHVYWDTLYFLTLSNIKVNINKAILSEFIVNVRNS